MLCPTTHLCTCHGHGASSPCPTGTYRPPPQKHRATCTSENQRPPTLIVEQVANAQAPPEPAPQQPPSPARPPGACQGSASESSSSSRDSTPSSTDSTVPAQPATVSGQLPDADRKPSESRHPPPSGASDTLQGPRLLASLDPFLSLPRMFCCNLVPCSAAPQPFAKHSSAAPSPSQRASALTNTQLAVDTTLVSPLTSAGAPRRSTGRTAGVALAPARNATAPAAAGATQAQLSRAA